VAQEASKSTSRLAVNGTTYESWAFELEAKLQEGEVLINELNLKVKELESNKTIGVREKD